MSKQLFPRVELVAVRSTVFINKYLCHLHFKLFQVSQTHNKLFPISKMLSSMLKEHQLKQIKKREEIEQKRNTAIASSVQFTTKVVNHLNDGVAQTYLNQRKLDSESKQLVANIEQFSRSINQWLTLMNNFNDSLKHLGDVENWAKVIEGDMKEISSILEYVYKSSNQNQPGPSER